MAPWHRHHLALFSLLLLLGGAACADLSRPRPRYRATPRAGRYYVVRPGDTVWEIARRFRTPVQDLAEWNNIQDPDRVRPGERLYLPGAARKASAPRRGRRNVRSVAAVDNEPIRLYHGQFQWPVAGPVHSPFGIRHERRHDGIDIGARAGAPIRAAAAGVVVFNETLAGYGRLLILRHPDQYYTAYAHNNRNVARLNQQVRQGEVIAYVGSTGHATGPHLHFEIRHGQQARNPLFFLPTGAGERALQAKRAAPAERMRAVRGRRNGREKSS